MKHIYKETLVYCILGFVVFPLVLLYVVYLVLFLKFSSIRDRVKELTGKDEATGTEEADKERNFFISGIFGPFFLVGYICDKIEDLKDKVFRKRKKK